MEEKLSSLPQLLSSLQFSLTELEKSRNIIVKIPSGNDPARLKEEMVNNIRNEIVQIISHEKEIETLFYAIMSTFDQQSNARELDDVVVTTKEAQTKPPKIGKVTTPKIRKQKNPLDSQPTTVFLQNLMLLRKRISKFVDIAISATKRFAELIFDPAPAKTWVNFVSNLITKEQQLIRQSIRLIKRRNDKQDITLLTDVNKDEEFAAIKTENNQITERRKARANFIFKLTTQDPTQNDRTIDDELVVISNDISYLIFAKERLLELQPNNKSYQALIGELSENFFALRSQNDRLIALSNEIQNLLNPGKKAKV